MTQHRIENLAGDKARIKMESGEEIVVTFGSDVVMNWKGGVENAKGEPNLCSEIHGHMEAKGNYGSIENAELILHDQRVFRISFSHSTYFTAHESANSSDVISD